MLSVRNNQKLNVLFVLLISMVIFSSNSLWKELFLFTLCSYPNKYIDYKENKMKQKPSQRDG